MFFIRGLPKLYKVDNVANKGLHLEEKTLPSVGREPRTS